MHAPQNAIGHTNAKVLVSALEHQVSRVGYVTQLRM